jgi:hypothetical protein
MNRNLWPLGVFHAVVWLVAIVGVERALEASAARGSYALLSAWWATLYLACLLATPWRAVAVFLAIMAVSLVVDVALGTGVLYHNAPAILSAGLFGLLLLMGVLWVSPFAINAAARWLRDRFARGTVGSPGNAV